MGRYLGFDFGAGSGRVAVGTLDNNGCLHIDRLERFTNSMINVRGDLYWDIFGLYREILAALNRYALRYGGDLNSIGIDTWGVDFGLLDDRGRLLGTPFTYRNPGNVPAMEKFLRIFPPDRLHRLTGIQIIPLNTVFQLYAMKLADSAILKSAADLLFIPDLFNYFLTGQKFSEFTFATTSQLFNPVIDSWETDIFTALEISPDIMQAVVKPGTVIGQTGEDITVQTGLQAVPVVAVASHDTASAVAAVPATNENSAYISSGTWSLIGVESDKLIVNEKTWIYNITNEGGACATFRILKNLAGLWSLQQCLKVWSKAHKYSYPELIRMAVRSAPINSVIDLNRQEFFSTPDMPAVMADFCRRTHQPLPRNIGQYVQIILLSLALAYRHALYELKEALGKDITQIHIVGGGSQNWLLCQYTANATGLPVYAGPTEAAVIGNILMQAVAAGEISSLRQLKEVVIRSFPLSLYEPQDIAEWDDKYERYMRLHDVPDRSGC